MYDEAYIEETQLIDFMDYRNITGRISGHSAKLRKVYFNKDINYLHGVLKGTDNFDRYSLNIRNPEDSRFQLERQSFREGTFYSTYTYLDKAQCDRLVTGDIEWMKDSSDSLIREMYIQMDINEIKPGVVVEYEREIYRIHCSSDMIMFDKSIKSSYDFEGCEVFSNELVLKERLEEGACVMTYHQPVMVPRVVASLLNFREGKKMILES